ncbi:MAG: hypothetical protein ACRDTJ_07750, partial [Pseudonocardiaceae bacterium]
PIMNVEYTMQRAGRQRGRWSGYRNVIPSPACEEAGFVLSCIHGMSLCTKWLGRPFRVTSLPTSLLRGGA